MNRKKWIAAGVMVILAAAVLVWFFAIHGTGTGSSATPAAAGQGSMPGMDMEGPQQGSPSPAPEEEAPTVEIPRDKQKLIGVQTTVVRVIPMKKTLRLTGRIESNEQRLATVNTKFEGWIEKLYVDYEGQTLKKGRPLLEIYSPELLVAQQELISLRAWKSPAGEETADTLLSSDTQKLKEAARKRLKLWDISDAEIAKIERTGIPIKSLTILSPVTGYVVKRYALSGMKVMPGEPLFDIADLSRVWVVSEVNETDIAQVRTGIAARITFTGLPGKVFDARVDFVYPSLNPETRTLKIRCTLPNPQGMLKPQMFATVEITADLGSRPAVPDDAVMDTGERQIVYVDRGEGLFEPREVKAGMRADGMREIIAGLKSGERIASSALFLIDSEAQLKGVAPVSR